VAIFETDRLRCQALSLADYADFERGVEPSWDGFTNPYKHLVEGRNPLRFRIPKVKQDPSFAELGLVLAISKDTNEIVGSAGFHDFPNKAGMIEVGFRIVEEKQNQGLGTELLLGMWNWICQRPDVKVLRYTVSSDNAPSMKIIKKLGFEMVGEQVDPDDGPELIFEQSVEDFLGRQGPPGIGSTFQ
jgi:ribosomal-protein-alanine N-acetyltransferase